MLKLCVDEQEVPFEKTQAMTPASLQKELNRGTPVRHASLNEV
jgi:hypothetical protein